MDDDQTLKNALATLSSFQNTFSQNVTGLLERTLKDVTSKYSRLKWTHDSLSKEAFDLKVHKDQLLQQLVQYDGGLTQAEAVDMISSLQSAQIRIATLESSLDTNLKHTKDLYNMIDDVTDTIRMNKKARIEAEAREEVAKSNLHCAEEQIKMLQDQLLALKDKENRQPLDEPSSPLRDVANLPHSATHQTSDDQILRRLQRELDRLKIKYDTLAAGKDVVGQKLFQNMVDWNDFKSWWKSFQAYDNVQHKIRQFQKETKNNALPTSSRVKKPSAFVKDMIGHQTSPELQMDILEMAETQHAEHDRLLEVKRSRLALVANSVMHGLEPVAEGPAAELEDDDMTQPETPVSGYSHWHEAIPTHAGDNDMNIDPTPAANEGDLQEQVVPSAAGPSDSLKTAAPLLHGRPVSPLRQPREEHGSIERVPGTPIPSTRASKLGIHSPSSLDKLPPPPPRNKTMPQKRKSNIFETDDESEAAASLAIPSEPSKKARRNDASGSTSKTASTSKDPYAQYKGRGRYAQAAKTAPDPGNRFEVNPDRNQGLNYAFDENVRNKEERRRLEATDCDCCRDYYDNLAPLPAMPKGPRWKSPTSSQDTERGARPCRKVNADSHKQSVSRHRAQWQGPSTPPDYWHIGFPSTQQQTDINRRAQEMQAEKDAQIEREAGKTNGKYRRK